MLQRGRGWLLSSCIQSLKKDIQSTGYAVELCVMGDTKLHGPWLLFSGNSQPRRGGESVEGLSIAACLHEGSNWGDGETSWRGRSWAKYGRRGSGFDVSPRMRRERRGDYFGDWHDSVTQRGKNRILKTCAKMYLFDRL